MTTPTTCQQGIFAQLVPLLVQRAVLMTISKLEDDRIQVNICPRQLKEGENPALTIPLCVTGTAAELDADLVGQISRFVVAHSALNSNLTAIEQEIAEAEKAGREAAKKRNKVVMNDGQKSKETVSSAAIVSKTEPDPQQMLSLFDQGPPAVGEQSTAAQKAVVHTE